MSPTVDAEVRLHGRRVGALRYDKGGSEFRYEDDLSAPDHKVLGQVFEDAPAALRRARVGVPAWFANLLPEGALRRQIIREMGGGNVGDFTLLLRDPAFRPHPTQPSPRRRLRPGRRRGADVQVQRVRGDL